MDESPTQVQDGSIRILRSIVYFQDGRPWDVEVTDYPGWDQVETSLTRMDDNLYPIVQLGTTESEDDESVFNVVGGAGRWALFRLDGSWKYVNPEGRKEEVRLWQSDQGYFCPDREVLYDISAVLKIVRRFYRTGTYEDL